MACNAILNLDALNEVRQAALDRKQIAGLTHTFYRYPARFSPTFARSAINAFSRTGDVVLDPYMGGGTTVVEAFALGRRAIGADINSLSCFVTRVKVTQLTRRERVAVKKWSEHRVQAVRYSDRLGSLCTEQLAQIPRNMSIAQARGLRKTIALCLNAAETELPTSKSRRFARCVMLNTGQWALNGRRSIPSSKDLRRRVMSIAADMLSGHDDLQRTLRRRVQLNPPFWPVLVESDAERLQETTILNKYGPADLVVTSPPYPGIHMLYHRWQVDGRKETDAPYWIAGCNDGAGSTYYNFAHRARTAEDRYFQKAEATFRGTRAIVRDGAIVVQMVAFSEPERQLKRYLTMMKRAGFAELREKHQRRIWRDVPGRRWHANFKGKTASSREVVLIHQAA